ncbi:MAG: LPS-assembly protein LptD, partial [Acidobacteriota bacterium]|nr:LPS-assembly protein LptD [Acidobacteriota bacterium]
MTISYDSLPSKCAHSRPGAFILGLLAVISFSLGAWAQQGCPAPPALQNSETTLTLRADHQSWVNHRYTGRGNVVLTYQKLRIEAAVVTYDEATSLIQASGHVVFDDPRGHLEAANAEYNINTGSGWFSNVHGYLRYASTQPNGASTSLFVRAKRIARVNEDTYTIEGARVSSCQNPNQGLAFGVDRAKIDIGNKITGREAIFKFVGVPVLYLPYLAVSASRKPRQTGFLVPQIGESTQKGFVVGDGFFWAINPSADLLLGLQDYSRRGLAFSGRFRATPSATSKITADFFGIDDRASGSIRNSRAPGASFDVVGETDNLGHGFRGVVNAGYVNSLAFRTTWSDTFNNAVFSEASQTGFATKNFDAYSINFFASRYQDFLSASPVNEQSIIIR